MRPQHIEAPPWFRRHIEQVAHAQSGRCREIVSEILVSLPKNLQVEREHQRGTLCGLGPVNEIHDKVTVLHDVELKPKWSSGVRGDIFDGTDAVSYTHLTLPTIY